MLQSQPRMPAIVSGDAGLPAWHALPAECCLREMSASERGLSAAEAAARLVRVGRNDLPTDRSEGLALAFLRQFRSPLIYLLLAAAAVSIALGHGDDAIFIGVVLLINATIGAVQERRAQTSMAALRRLIRQSARVRRDDVVLQIDARDLVPGDVVVVESGIAAAADMRLLSSTGLRLNEAALTGESLAVGKDAAVLAPVEAGVGDRPNMLHAGTLVEEGRGIGLVVATGSATQLGVISASLHATPAPPPPIILRLERLARQIAFGTVALILMLALLLAQQGAEVGAILLLAVALAVSAIPEGLPIAVTVALAAATRRMAARGVIVRTLPAVEGLGACTLIASDKTGTLTQNRLSVECVLLPDGRQLGREEWADPAALPLARAAALCNEAVPGPGEGAVGDSVDVALATFANEAGADFAAASALPRLALLPYEPVRRFAAVCVALEGRATLAVKGAPEAVLPMCVGAPDPGPAELLAAAGYRVLAVASRALAPGDAPGCANPSGLQLLGFVGLLDPIRPEVPGAIARCTEAGIKVRMITGDHPGTALTIARQLGLDLSSDQVVTGRRLAELFDRPDRLAAEVLRGRIFARIEPAQKLRIVETLSAAGEIVAVTGDGVNDAPALQAAHIGVAMGLAGTDVARGASDLVLADDNFASIVAGVEEGRITYANVRKIVIFLLATGIAEIFMFVGAVAAGLPMPLTAVQLLWTNLVTNGAQDVMLGFGRGEGDELRRPPRSPEEPIVDRTALALMIPPAATMSLFALGIVHWGIARGMPLADIQNVVLLMTVLFQNAYVLCMRSEGRALYREPLLSNPWLLLGVLMALGLQLLATYWQPLRAVLETGPVAPEIFALCLAGMMLIVLVTEGTKLVVRRVYGPLRIKAAASSA